MLNFDELKEATVPHEICMWCDKHANSHLALLSAWEAEPDYMGSLETLEQCLAWAVQQGKKVVIARIMGKYRRLRQVTETEAFELLFGNKPNVPDCLL